MPAWIRIREETNSEFVKVCILLLFLSFYFGFKNKFFLFNFVTSKTWANLTDGLRSLCYNAKKKFFSFHTQLLLKKI
jgi:hypothetical protein